MGVVGIEKSHANRRYELSDDLQEPKTLELRRETEVANLWG
jgi:hypothetical protein